MHVTDRRLRLRDYFQREGCIRPASVFDPVSSRTAYALGFEVGMLGGSIASAVILGAPDVAVMTLTELAGQVRRITRASDISQVIDADNGYGNALNVMRTIHELEDAGASGMTIEDTSLPSRYGSGGKEELISLDEMTRQAARRRRCPPGRHHRHHRTHPRHQRHEPRRRRRARRRLRRDRVDAIFLMGTGGGAPAGRSRSHEPALLLGTTPESLTPDVLAPYGVKIALRGHGTFTQTVRTIYESLEHQASGAPSAELADREPTPEMMATATGAADYRAARDAYMA